MGHDITAVILLNEIKQNAPEDILDVRVQAEWISEVLNELGYSTVLLPFSANCIRELVELKESGPIFVVNLVDAAPGEEDLGYQAPSILETLQIPYTGCAPEVLALTTDKVLTKKLLQSFGMPTPEWAMIDDGGSFVANERYIIKALREDASIGLDNTSVLLIRHRSELNQAIAQREAALGETFFAERYIEGREFNVCIYGKGGDPIVLPPYEWIFPGFEEAGLLKIIDYDAKWTENTFEYDNLQAVYRLPEEDNNLIDELIRLTKTCYKKFRMNGYARIDYRVDCCGRPWILEINANPSFYGFYNVAREYELSFGEIIQTIVDAID